MADWSFANPGDPSQLTSITNWSADGPLVVRANLARSGVQPDAGFNATTITFGGYDANGNPGTISASPVPVATVALTYDAQHRLQTYTFGQDEATIAYDAAGHRSELTWTNSTGSYRLQYHYLGLQLAQLVVTTTAGGSAPPECASGDTTGCTESFVYRPDGTPLELLYTSAST